MRAGQEQPDFLVPQVCRKKQRQLKLPGSLLGLNAFGNVCLSKLVNTHEEPKQENGTHTPISCQWSLSVARCLRSLRVHVHTHLHDIGLLVCKMQITEIPDDI